MVSRGTGGMMGLTYIQLKKVAPYIKGDVLSLGYPDLAVTAAQCEDLLGVRPTHFTHHGGWHGVKEPIPETKHVFDALGAKLTCIDHAIIRGDEQVFDLNYPQSLGEYDLVIDPGTTEHCFNVGQALMNAANAVKPGGHIFHCGPLSMVNHGFYNFCPTLFHDFYTQNDWSVEISASRGAIETALDETGRHGVGPEWSLLVIAQRKTDDVLKFPIQTKYLKHPKLEVAA